MGQKSIQVPQPEFSNWIIKKRQELNLSPSCLRKKVQGKLCERTLKYLEDGKRNSFSEYTLTILAQGLELNYPELLEVIDQLNHKSPPNEFLLKQLFTNKFILFFVSSLFVLLIFLFFIGKNGDFFKSDNRLSDVQIHSQYPQVIIAFDEKGDKLWQKNIKNSIKMVAKSDLNRDGDFEVIAATYKQNSEDMGKRPGWLFVWNEQGDLITELNLWKASIYPALEPRACIEDFKIIDLENDETLEIIVAVRGEQYYPSRIAVLHFQDSKFEEVKSYWNPGYVLKLFIEDVDNDNLPEIVCSCVNNDFKRVPEFGLDDNVYSIFMLKGTKIYGQAPPYLGDEQIGSEVWYRYITPPSSNEISKIIDVTFMGDGEKSIHVKLNDSCFFYLDYVGNIVDTFEGDYCRGETQLHLIQRGKSWK